MHSSLPFSFFLFYKFFGTKIEAIKTWFYDWPLGQTDRDETVTYSSSYAASCPAAIIKPRQTTIHFCVYVFPPYSLNLYSIRRVAIFKVPNFFAIITNIQLNRQLTKDTFTTFFYHASYSSGA
jgi:hypothetical protein